VVRPGPAPFASLAAALASQSPPGGSPNAEALRTDPNALATWVKDQQSAGRKLLLVIDQAEELITMNSDGKVTQQYLALIDNALNADERLRIVVTVRSEFEPQFAQSALMDRWLSSRYLVPPMTQDELRRVIEGPATVKVMRFESADLVDTLVNEVVQMPGALPLLSFALSEMYTNYLRRPADDRTLTSKDYDALEGGVAGSLRVRANRLIDDLDEPHKLTARRVLERLVSIESGEFARRRVLRRELKVADTAENTRVEEILRCLVDARLIVTDEVENQPSLELAHDALILGWDRLRKSISSAVISPDGKRLLTASWDGTARMWNIDDGTPFGSAMSHETDWVQFAYFSSDGRYVVSGSDRSIYLWDAKTGYRLVDPIVLSAKTDPEGYVRSAGFSPDGTSLITLSTGRAAVLWRLTDQPRPTIERVSEMVHEAPINSAIFSGRGHQVATASDDYTVRLWTVGDESGKVVAQKRYPGSESSAFSPDGKFLMTEGADSDDRKLFTVPDGKPFGKPIPVGGFTTAVAFSTDGTRVFISSRKGGQVWDVLSQNTIGKPIAAGWADDASFTSDGRLLTVSSQDAPRFWDARTGEPVGQPLTYLGIPRAARLSPDEKYLVTASRNTTAQIWNLSTKARVGQVLRHDARVWSAVFRQTAALY
jgi:WD40 repeat protein